MTTDRSPESPPDRLRLGTEWRAPCLGAFVIGLAMVMAGCVPASKQRQTEEELRATTERSNILQGHLNQTQDELQDARENQRTAIDERNRVSASLDEQKRVSQKLEAELAAHADVLADLKAKLEESKNKYAQLEAEAAKLRAVIADLEKKLTQKTSE